MNVLGLAADIMASETAILFLSICVETGGFFAFITPLTHILNDSGISSDADTFVDGLYYSMLQGTA